MVQQDHLIRLCLRDECPRLHVGLCVVGQDARPGRGRLFPEAICVHEAVPQSVMLRPSRFSEISEFATRVPRTRVRVCIEIEPGDRRTNHVGRRVHASEPIKVGPYADAARRVATQYDIFRICQAKIALQGLQNGIENDMPGEIQPIRTVRGFSHLTGPQVLCAVRHLHMVPTPQIRVLIFIRIPVKASLCRFAPVLGRAQG